MGHPAPIQSGSLIGQLARTIETLSWKNRHVCISYYFRACLFAEGSRVLEQAASWQEVKVV